ncbi:hypothetical protein LEP1GSC111_4207 [Leptospira interrogans str. UT126]|uniref:hypothetical protein n=1 Tax=Leptospira interrogans TaxID=173 RepID=UPI0002C0068D|nr:hypothetical protein [Leptospira interrogans]EMJ55930.1 hypothetical protein LEP1GSC111_4207 [Leptospira interrogans str. UT126]
MTLKELQLNLPWTVKYSEDFRSTPLTHKDFSHALHHVSKAAGKLHGFAQATLTSRFGFFRKWNKYKKRKS